MFACRSLPLPEIKYLGLSKPRVGFLKLGYDYMWYNIIMHKKTLKIKLFKLEFTFFFPFKVLISCILLCVHPFPLVVWREFPAASPLWSLTSWQWRDWAGRTRLLLWRWSDPVLAPTWVSSASSRSLRPLKRIRWVHRHERRDTDAIPPENKCSLHSFPAAPWMVTDGIQRQPLQWWSWYTWLACQIVNCQWWGGEKTVIYATGRHLITSINEMFFHILSSGSHQSVMLHHSGPIWNLNMLWKSGCLSQLEWSSKYPHTSALEETINICCKYYLFCIDWCFGCCFFLVIF